MKLLAAALALGLVVGQSGPQPRFRSGVDLVEVTVLVRDRDGRPVPDLTAADFVVSEGGTRQTIVALERVSIPVRAAGEPAAAPAVPNDVASNEQISNSRFFVLVLDALHVESRRTRVVRAYARRFIEEHVGPSDLVAVVSPGALPSATQDFTRDRARLLAAVDQFAGTKLMSATVEIEKERLALEMPLHGGRDPSDGERANRAESLSSVLEALAAHLGRVENRRKTLLLFSEGIDYEAGDVMGVRQQRGNDVLRAMDRAIGALMRTNVSLYAIDPRALGTAEGDLVETPVFAANPSATSGSVTSEYSDSIRSLHHAADSTGGFAAVDRNEIGPAFERILDESSDYYVLAYAPAKPARHGEFREIDVHVSRPGLRVVARKGYVAAPAAAPGVNANAAAEINPTPVIPGRPSRGRVDVLSMPSAEPAARPVAGVPAELTSLLASPLPRAGLPIRVQAVPLKGSGRKTAVHLVVEVLGRSLSFADRGGRFEERIELALLTVDDRARADNGKNTRIDLRVPAADLDRVKTTGVRWLSRLDLDPGRYQIRVAARAEQTRASGMITQDVEVPSFEAERAARALMSGVTLTSLPSVLMLTRGDGWLQEALGAPPSAARSFVIGDHIRAGVEVYVPGSLAADLEVASHVSWPDGTRSGATRRKIARGTGQARTDELTFAIDTTAFPPGRYVLHVTLDPSGAATSERQVPFEVVR